MVATYIPATFTGCTFYKSIEAGLYVGSGAPFVTGCTFLGNNIGIEMDGTASAANISGNTLNHEGSGSLLIYAVADCIEDLVSQNTLLPRADGKLNLLGIKASTLTTSATWPTPPSGFVYYIANELVGVKGASSPVLTLGTGTIFKLLNDPQIYVGYQQPGGLVATGVIYHELC